jgi:hypothetical protein
MVDAPSPKRRLAADSLPVKVLALLKEAPFPVKKVKTPELPEMIVEKDSE